MVNTVEYKTANPKLEESKDTHNSSSINVNFHDPIIKNKLTLLSCLLISCLFLLIAIAGASSGMFRASGKIENSNIEHTCGWSNCREPVFRDLYDIDDDLASSGAFFGFVIIISWLFTLVASAMVYAHLWYGIAESFQIKNKLIHHNHIMFYGIMTIEILLIIAIILFHYEFGKYTNNVYTKYQWWPTWGMWFTYFAFITLLIGQCNINEVIIEHVTKDDEILKMKAKQVTAISNNNNNNSSNNNNNNNGNKNNNSNNINNNNNNNNNNMVTMNRNIDDGYESDDEQLGIKLRPHNDTNTIDIEIDDDDEH